MKVLVHLFHPHLERSVVNHTWAERLANQPGITLRNRLWPNTTAWCSNTRSIGTPPHR